MRIVACCFIPIFMLPSYCISQSLSPEQWRQDLVQLTASVKEIHFKPFHQISEDEFQTRIDNLDRRLAQLSDSEIILEMAQIIALLRDGHSRIHIPRLYPQFALEAELGHSGTPPPNLEILKFHQAPVQFQFFDNGVYVIAATEQYQALIGHKVLGFDSTGIEDALEAVKSVSFFENNSRAKLMAPDRLALPQVLHFLNVIEDESRFTLVTEDLNGTVQRTQLYSLSLGGEPFIDQKPEELPLWTRNRDANKWFQILGDLDAIYVQVNQFEENPPLPYGDFVADTLAAAREASVEKYVVDLRHNSGGIGAWVTPFVTGLANSEFNTYGRLFILMGRTTFSAAQTFLHRFEEFTYALFVGEPSGAKPSHFGDSQRIVLDNSGLTLRLSTIYWHSWLANDFRDAINPHISTTYNSEDFFSGADPGLEAALEYSGPDLLAEQMEEQFRQEKNQNALLLYNRYMTDARFQNHRQVVPDLLKMADRLINDGIQRPGYFVYVIVNQSFPGDRNIEAELFRLEALF